MKHITLVNKAPEKENKSPLSACGWWATDICGVDPEGCGNWSRDCCSISDGGPCGIGSFDCTDKNG